MKHLTNYFRIALLISTVMFFATNTFAQSHTEYLCIIDDSGNKVEVAQFITTVLPSGDVHAKFITSKAVNDNSYGIKEKDGGPDYSVGWGNKTHQFKDLVGSDKAIFKVYGETGNLVMDFELDYIGIDPNALSGYASHGIDKDGEKSDGELFKGQESWLVDYNTSLSQNLNELGYESHILLSPETVNDNSYEVLNAGDENWIFEMIYEVTIAKEAFGSNGYVGSSSIQVPDLHNSPDKIKLKDFDIFNCEPPVCDGEIGDRVWLDFSVEGALSNCDGIQDAGEPGIPNVTLELRDDMGMLLKTTTTDANGFYQFLVDDLCDGDDGGNLPCGDCEGGLLELTLKYNGNSGSTIKAVNDNETLYNNTLFAGDEFTVYGTKADGKFEKNDLFLYVDDVENTVIHVSCSKPVGIGTVFGDFVVTGGISKDGGALCDQPGGGIDPPTDKCYTVTVVESTLPAGYSASVIYSGSDPTKDSNSNPEDVCLNYQDNTDNTIDFGYCAPPADCDNTIGDLIWHDSNANGIQDTGEEGIAGVVVTISGNSINQTTASNSDGNYYFTNIPNGTYQIELATSNFQLGGALYSSASERWYYTKRNIGDDAKDSDANASNPIVTVDVSCNDNLTIDFGFYKTCMTMIKEADKTTAQVGDVISYSFTVTNCGDVKLGGGVNVYDDMLKPGEKLFYIILNPGESKTITSYNNFDFKYTVKEEDCGKALVNTARAEGHPVDGSGNLEVYASWTVDIDDCVAQCGGIIGDYVFVDNTGDCNGTQTGSTPIVGAQVRLTYTENSQTITKTTTTNLQGKYSFAELCANTYKVEIVSLPSPQYDGFTMATTGSYNVTLNDNQEYLSADFGFCAPPELCGGIIGDYVFVDNTGDCNGTQTGSTPIVGAQVRLTYTENSQTITKTVVTNTSGKYAFAGLCANTYKVEIVSLPSPQYDGYTLATTGSYNVTLIDNQEYLSADFGYCEPPEVCGGIIGDYVFVENTDDCNGTQLGSTPIVGAQVQLTYTENSQTIVKTAVTNANGKYFFTELCANTYKVEIVSLPSPQYDDYTLSTVSSYNVTLSDNQQDLDADFGYCAPAPCVGDGKIGDLVWLDFTVEDAATNCNGIQDTGEPGIQGVKVILKNASGVTIATDITDQNGNYLFENLCTDNNACYLVFVDQSTLPSGTSPTLDDQGSDDAVDSDGSGVEVCLSDNNKEDLTIDFGFCTDGCGGCETACLGDYVWLDTNGNGIQDANEVGVDDITVELYNQNSYKIATEVTIGGGFYSFTNLIPGYYYVKFILPQGYIFTSKNQGSDSELDSDAGANGRTATNIFLAGECDLSWDAGIIPTPPNPSCLGDLVWFDTNHDGIQDLNEMGVKDVTVKLLDGSNSVLETTVTDQFGYYKFNNISAGTYRVKFDLPSGYEFTLQNVGDDDLDSDVGVNGYTALITIGVSDCQLHWDAGLYAEIPDLSLNKVVDNPNPDAGDQIKFTITVNNAGPGNATGIEVTDYLPLEGLTYTSYSSSQGSFNSSTGIWTVGSVDANYSATLDLFFTVEEWDNGVEFEAFDLGVASDYNVFALCSVNFPSSDVECRMAVGWDAYLSNYSVGDKLPSSSSQEDALVVGRNLTFTSGAVFGGNVVYGISSNLPTGQVSISGGSLIQDPNRIDFAAAGAHLKDLSSQLAAYTVNGTTTYQWGGIELVGDDPLLNVFQLSGEELTNAHSMSITVPNGSVVVVNINGDNISWSGGLVVNGTAINNVLYNFYQATFITIQGIDVRGSILAPCATVDFISGVQNGQMIAKHLMGRGQYNCEPFLGNIPKRPNITNTAEITAVIENDPDSSPGNGIVSEDDYASATVFFSSTENNGGSGSGDDYGWEPVSGTGITDVIWSMSNDIDGNLLMGTAGGNLYRSLDGGLNWTVINGSMNVGFIWSIAVNSTGTIFLGTEQGIYYSSDDGSNWTGPAGGLMYDIRTVVIDPSTDYLYAGTWGFGVLKSTDNGLTFTTENDGLGYMLSVQALTSTSNGIYVGSVGGGISYSGNGSNWTSMDIEYKFIWTLASTSTDIVFAGTYGDGLWKSSADGTTFEKCEGITASYIYSITIDANDNIYASSWEAGVFVSEDGGFTWNTLGMGGYGVSSLLVDQAGTQASQGTILAGTSEGTIYRKSVSSLTEVDIIEDMPTEFGLAQNYPNPFNPSTRIEFSIAEAGLYVVKVFNMLGQEVATVADQDFSAGTYTFNFDASNLTSGIYFYKLVGDKVNMTKKMILLK